MKEEEGESDIQVTAVSLPVLLAFQAKKEKRKKAALLFYISVTGDKPSYISSVLAAWFGSARLQRVSHWEHLCVRPSLLAFV